jgi:hypothetical protein
LALQVHFELVDERVVGDLFYSTDLYEEAWARALADQLVRSLRNFGAA